MEDKRLTRMQRSALIILICLETLTDDCEKDLAVRMDGVDAKDAFGRKAESAKALLREMVDDALKTLDEDQLNHLRKTARDYELRLTPKLTPQTGNMVVHKETLRTLIDAAQNRCVDCFDTEAESRGCKLQRLLAVLIPMDKYENTGLCAYNNREWEN